jgi:hypothetical protein
MTVSANSSGIFSSPATLRAAPYSEMLRIKQFAFERPKLIEPDFGMRVE